MIFFLFPIVNRQSYPFHNNTAPPTRPRPQPITGTPPPIENEKMDAKVIQQTCTLFGLDLVSLILNLSSPHIMMQEQTFF